MWDIFPFSLFRVHAVSFCFWVFFLLSLFPSLFASTEKRADQYETLKLSLCAWKLEICVPAEHSLHTYTLPVCCSASTYLCAQEICVILHPSLKGEKKRERKRKKVSFILRQEPSQCSMPNWHHTLVLSTLSCRSCTATGLFNKLKVCLGLKKEKNVKGRDLCACVCVHALASGLATCNCERNVQEAVTCPVLPKPFLNGQKARHETFVTFGEYLATLKILRLPLLP